MSDPQKTILVIDDYEDNLMFMKLSLENEGYYVRLADNGKKGLLEIYQDCPDLIILDLMMPIMSGLEVIENLKANSSLSQIPIILLTANEDFTHKSSLAVEAVLYKPVNIDCMLSKIELLLSAKKSFKVGYRKCEMK